jgi:hypothetical protein
MVSFSEIKGMEALNTFGPVKVKDVKVTLPQCPFVAPILVACWHTLLYSAQKTSNHQPIDMLLSPIDKTNKLSENILHGSLLLVHVFLTPLCSQPQFVLTGPLLPHRSRHHQYGNVRAWWHRGAGNILYVLFVALAFCFMYRYMRSIENKIKELSNLV